MPNVSTNTQEITFMINGRKMQYFGRIAYKARNEKGKVYNSEGICVGATQGKFEYEGSMSLLRTELDSFISRLQLRAPGIDVMQIKFDLSTRQDRIDYELEGCHLTDTNGPGGTMVELPLAIERARRNGISFGPPREETVRIGK